MSRLAGAGAAVLTTRVEQRPSVRLGRVQGIEVRPLVRHHASPSPAQAAGLDC